MKKLCIITKIRVLDSTTIVKTLVVLVENSNLKLKTMSEDEVEDLVDKSFSSYLPDNIYFNSENDTDSDYNRERLVRDIVDEVINTPYSELKELDSGQYMITNSSGDRNPLVKDVLEIVKLN